LHIRYELTTFGGMKLPDKLQYNYGQEMKAEGYRKGYNQCMYDMRRLKRKEKSIFDRFCKWADHLEDVFSENRKK